MRAKVPAALLLVLSWFLPATGHAQLLHAVTAHAAAEQTHQGGHHPGARKSPLPPSTAQALTFSHETTGGTALLPPGVPRPALPPAGAVRAPGGAGFAAAGHETTPARAPPSSTAL
ncbi:hypothetical protein ACQEUU_22175 [Nonomuraea sp. CA-218870]|uniref:hypothetical protein n=1 Tax=Nonomuraea sp. CA-218870 TaxID=3239998 RepID=UPI003D8F1A95